MKQTENFKLSLMEASDLLSAKPLNENAEKIDTALAVHAAALSGKLMMAVGTYVGNDTRSVTVQTPGFKPQAMLMREQDPNGVRSGAESGMSVSGGWCLWLGSDLPAEYSIGMPEESGYIEKYEYIQTTVKFTPEFETITWSIPRYPDKYTDVRIDHGYQVVNNAAGKTYEWIAFGAAE